MESFKVGDRVEIISDKYHQYEGMKKGCICVVRDMSGKNVHSVYIEDKSDFWFIDSNDHVKLAGNDRDYSIF